MDHRVVNIADLRVRARRRLPRMVFDYVDGGAGDERTMREKCETQRGALLQVAQVWDSEVAVRRAGRACEITVGAGETGS